MSLTGKDIQTGQADMISENIYNEKSCYMEPVRPQAGKTDRGHRDHTSLRRRSRKRIRKKDRNDLFGNTISAANDRKKTQEAENASNQYRNDEESSRAPQ